MDKFDKVLVESRFFREHVIEELDVLLCLGFIDGFVGLRFFLCWSQVPVVEGLFDTSILVIFLLRMDWLLDFGKWCLDQWVLELLFLLVTRIGYLQVEVLLSERLLLFLWFLLCLWLWYHWKRFRTLYAFEHFRRFVLLCGILSLLMIFLLLLRDFQMRLCWYVYLRLVHTGFNCLANRLWWYDTTF